jgi:hypothetical protein
MAAQPITTRVPHGDLPASFPNGELWLQPWHLPILSIPKDTYYMARRFVLKGGTYFIKMFVDDAETMWIGKSFTAAAMVHSQFIADDVVTRELYLPAGEQRIDFIIENLPVFDTPCGIVFSLWQDGHLVYASAADGWVWDTMPIPDEVLPLTSDPRRVLPVFSMLPNWDGGITERLEWLSDVMTSETGAEQRRTLRTRPRRSFESGFLRKGPNRTWLDSFLVSVGQNLLLMPLWHEAIVMVEGIEPDALGVTFAQGAANEREFYEGDLVFVNNGDPNTYDVLMVGDVADDRFTWATPPERSWPKGTRIYPMREARITDAAALSNRTEDVATVQIRFSLQKPYTMTAAWIADMNGRPFFPFRPNRMTDIGANYARLTNTLDNSVGTPFITDISEHTAVTMSLAFTFFGRHRIHQYRQFLAAATGRTKGFFVSTYTHDIEPYANVIEASDILLAKPMGGGMFYRVHPSSRTHIGITLVGQNTPAYFRRIIAVEKQYADSAGLDVNYETDVWYDRFRLDAVLPALTRSQIARISFVSEARFDQDSFEIQHVSNTSVAIKTACVIRQLGERRMRPNLPPPQPIWPSVEPVPTGIITASSMSVTDSSQGATSEVVYTLRNDGVIETFRYGLSQRNEPGIWTSVLTEAACYEVKAEKVYGEATLRYGALGTWQRLSSTRSWALQAIATTETVVNDVALELQFRDVATQTLQRAARITLVASAANP